MKEKEEKFILNDYGKQPTFASFLPGIAGEKGIPIWCYYVNRGQGIVSFGIENKDKAIMEFYPAHQAYQNVSTTGFRTFIRQDDVYYEAFVEETAETQMKIGMNELTITENNLEKGLETTVTYYTLPGENLGALVRSVTVKNIAQHKTHLEILDGMPAMIPFGINMDNMKNMCQTAKAWMQAEALQNGAWYYRVRASLADTTSVQEILGGNFAYGCLADGTLLQVISDPELVFSYDNSMRKAVGFATDGLSALLKREQMLQNQLPCSFFAIDQELAPQETVTWYEIIGQVANQDILQTYLAKRKDAVYFQRKLEEANDLTVSITRGITTHTASKEFDAYCKYTYMDNVLRGGLPKKLGNNKVFYVYSRKHGDLERDYNYFSMLPEYYSQGNGNYRDVNQNRRCDTFFAPFVGTENIKIFFSLIQLDGYNPLGVEKITYQLSQDKAELLFGELEQEQAKKLTEFVKNPFTPGSLYHMIQSLQGEVEDILFNQIIDFADSTANGNFIEGYWCDHWTYNLDLIEEYLEIYPDREQELLWEEDYTWYVSQVNINRRYKRYAQTNLGIRQYHALNQTSARQTKEKILRDQYGQGHMIKGSLIERLLLLCTIKFATLDPYGMGIEMEGGKPGWYDALNGLPGLFGSSMSETYELARLLHYCIQALENNQRDVMLLSEIACLMDELHLICRLQKEEVKTQDEVLEFWNRINDAKELYREKSYQGVSGEKTQYHAQDLREILQGFLAIVNLGIKKAIRLSKGEIPTYFTYEMVKYEIQEQGIKPLQFKVNMVPKFLEGSVRFLKLPNTLQQKEEIYQQVKHSDLFDEKLKMYKVNASLSKVSFEYGRARAFTPGWLENESIWLHMEYKYLLELLKSGLYSEFFADFKAAAVPFLNPAVYGRSIFENSSFIASSKNPDQKLHGRGFVARLSGSTIEFINMWKIMMFGQHLFHMEQGQLVFTPQPVIPAYLVPENGILEATLLGNTQVIYHFPEQKDYIPDNYQITQINMTYNNKSTVCINGQQIVGRQAEDMRAGKVKMMEIMISVSQTR